MNEVMFSELLVATRAFEEGDAAEVTSVLRRMLTEHGRNVYSLPRNAAEDLEEALLALEDSDPTTAGVLGGQALADLVELLPANVHFSLLEAARAVSHQNFGYAAITLRSVIRHYHPHLTLAATA